jgi:hypothetical protein
MDLFHDTACPCAYCGVDREERAASRRALKAFLVFFALGLILGYSAGLVAQLP